MEKIIITGNIGNANHKNVNGQFLMQFSVAVNNGYYDNNNQWVERTNWWNCKIWREKNMSDKQLQSFAKGRKILVEGHPDLRTYKDNSGQTHINMGIKVQTYEFQDTQKKDFEPAANREQQVSTTEIDNNMPY